MNHEEHMKHMAKMGQSAVHTMAGVPLWMAMLGLAVIILGSHLLLLYRRRKYGEVLVGVGVPYGRFNLLQFAPLRALVKSSVFPTLLQIVPVFLLFLIIIAGLFGSQRVNIAPVLTWTWWWVLLIFIIVGLGKSFCAICPWEGLSTFLTTFSLTSRIKKMGFEKRWPRFARNIYPALGLFIILTWLELGLNVTNSPSLTGVLALLMTSMAVMSAMLFEKRAFCRYACLVGRISGLYALFAPLELRPKSESVCTSCETKDCIQGTETELGCPMFLNPGALTENTYCTLCTKCVRTCPSDNIGLNFRPPAQDLMQKETFRRDEAVLAVVLLALTSFHGLTMTPLWTTMNNGIRVATGLGPTAIFTILMAASLVLPYLLFQFASYLGRILSQTDKQSGAKIFTAFAYSLIPVALFYHLAHNGMHFFMEAQNILPVLSDPFGLGWDIFGTAKEKYGALLSLSTIWWLQMFLIVTGHLYGVVVADKIGQRLFTGARELKLSLIPQIIVMILFSAYSIWLIAQPMEMRTGM